MRRLQRRAGLVVREHRLLARGRSSAPGGRTRRSRTRWPSASCARLGLESTSFDEPDLAGTGKDVPIDGPYPRARRPSGGLISTVEDLLRFGQRHLARPTAPGCASCTASPPQASTAWASAANASAESRSGATPGSYGGFQTSFLVVPDRDAVFVGLTNSSRGANALHEIENTFFERVIGERRAEAETVALPKEAREAFVGTYANSTSWTDVAIAGSGLALTLDDERSTARAIGPHTFEITSGDSLHDRFDFPLEGFGRFGSRLAERVS